MTVFSSQKIGRSRGFTLLELLIAMTIVTMLMVIIFSGFYLGMNSWKKGNERIDRQQRLRIILDQFEQDIRSIFFLKVKCSPDGVSNQKAIAVKADTNKFTFVSMTQGLTSEQARGKSAIRMVSYYVNDGQDDEKKGFVMEEFAGYVNFFDSDEPESKVYQLDPDVTDISFKYYRIYKDPDKAAKKKGIDSDLEKEELPKGEWVSSWDPCKELTEDEEDEAVKQEQDIEKPEYSAWIGAIDVTITTATESEDDPDIELSRIIPIISGMEVTLDKKL